MPLLTDERIIEIRDTLPGYNGYALNHVDFARAIEAVVREDCGPDTARLDALEAEIDDGPLLLHNKFPEGCKQRGLGLRSTGRPLRLALDQMRGIHAHPTDAEIAATDAAYRTAPTGAEG